MELRHVRYFLAVAEEGNFTRAAARLGIGQPPLSLQIRDLEAEVGTPLFLRRPHGVELTEAGIAFRDEVRTMPLIAQAAIGRAQRAADGEIGQLRLGFTATAALNPSITAAIRAFRAAYPRVGLKLEESNSVTMIEGLLQERLDVAILRPSASDPPALTIQTLLSEPLVAALPDAHPAAGGRGALDLRKLCDDPIIMTPREVGYSLHDTILRACREAGFEPHAGPFAPQIVSVLSLVSAGIGVSLVPASIRQLALQGVTYRSLRPTTPRVMLGVAHRIERPSQLVLNFARIARQQADRQAN